MIAIKEYGSQVMSFFFGEPHLLYKEGFSYLLKTQYQAAYVYLKWAVTKGSIPYPPAFLYLGWLSAEGGYIGGRNKKQSKAYYEKAGEYWTWFKKEAEQASSQDKQAQAFYHLGICYAEGIAVEKDEGKALDYYRESAKGGFVFAYYVLGECYRLGKETEKDEGKAIFYYEKAVKFNFAPAIYGLGLCYANERSVLKDEAKALYYYELAAKQGYAFAQCNLGFHLEKGKGVPVNKDEAIRYYLLAAKQGLAAAQYNLGCCFETDPHLPQNLEKALFYFKQAADQGYRLAKQAFLDLQTRMERGEIIAWTSADVQKLKDLQRLATVLPKLF